MVVLVLFITYILYMTNIKLKAGIRFKFFLYSFMSFICKLSIEYVHYYIEVFLNPVAIFYNLFWYINIIYFVLSLWDLLFIRSEFMLLCAFYKDVEELCRSCVELSVIISRVQKYVQESVDYISYLSVHYWKHSPN